MPDTGYPVSPLKRDLGSAPASIQDRPGTSILLFFPGQTEIKGGRSFQLTVFAAAPIESGGSGLPCFKLRLAADAQANSGNCLAASFRNSSLALLTVGEALALRQPASGQFDGVLYTGVYLILYASVTSPTNSHNQLLLASS
jgi:hypothetical protein